jgi:thioredoxin-like negative regulator of GroEL
MSNQRAPRQRPPATPGSPSPSKAPSVIPSPARVLFRKIDWLTFLITFLAVWLGYYLTLAPEVTLEDSGELATGSFYAGIPHPPGYPVWTIYTWLWTVLLPLKNVARRVALGEATGGALAAGLLGLLVSRGSSLLMEGIEELKGMTGRWENAICMVSGFVAALLLGFNGFMWSQSVIVEVYSFSVASLMLVLLCLLRWIYAPQQRRYLYLALFFHGICFTNHQTLIVAAMGIEVAIAAAHFRMGRSLWLGNSVVFFVGLILKMQHILTSLEQNRAVFVIFKVVGCCSLAAYFWFAYLTKETLKEFVLDACIALFFVGLAAISAIGQLGLLLAAVALAGGIKMALDTWRLGWEWLVVILLGCCWVAGAAFYFYMPIAGMTNPPMEWGYPRTVEGFIHAFTRGQYGQAVPTDILHDPMRFITQLGMLGRGIIDEFNWVNAFLALVPFMFFFKLHRRERAWLIGISAIYLCLGVLLLILLNPPPDRAAQELVRVFFTASHTLIALLVGYGLTLAAAYMATHYQQFRSWGLIGGAVAVALALLSFTELTRDTFFGEAAPLDLAKLLSFVGQTFGHKYQYGLPVYAGLMLIGLAAGYLCAVGFYRDRAPLAITLALFALMPAHSILTHWSDNEQRNHWFGYWFGHDMFSPPFKGPDNKPLYPDMTKDTVLFGGTDPGRFCPTYMIFCESFLPAACRPAADPNFDRRDVYLITQNALADGTYLNYIRAQYNRSTQSDPPFFQELFRSDKERQENYATNVLARAVQPLDRFFMALGDRVEKRRRTFTSWFTGTDFIDLAGFAARLAGPQKDPVSQFIWDNLEAQTQQLLKLNGGEEQALRDHLANDLNLLLDRELHEKELLGKKNREKAVLERKLGPGAGSESKRQRLQLLEAEIAELKKIEPFYEPDRFKQVQLPEYLQDFIAQNPQSHTRVRLNRLLLEAAYPAYVAKSPGGVYPDREIHTPTPEEASWSVNEYLTDAQRRMQAHQLDPGEEVQFDKESGKVRVEGQIAVMGINGVLTKVIFDHNPKNEFYVEESYPLKWMFPHLTPYGIIMKINRRPVPELTQEIVERDHAFWTQYSQRLIGDWISYDTPVKDITAWVEQVYLRRDFNGFTGDRKFIRDDQAQKAFSKLRSAIGGVYNWRVANSAPGTAEHERMIKEADFAFRQSFAFCPYSSEALYRYITLLTRPEVQRLEDALLIAETCQKLDPNNVHVLDLLNRLRTWNKQRAQFNPPELEKVFEQNTDNFQAAFDLANAYIQTAQTDRALAVLDRVVQNPHADANTLRAVAQGYVAINNLPKLEVVFEKLVVRAPDSPEDWYNLAGLKATLGKTPDALQALRQAVTLSAKRLRQDPKAKDLLADAQTDPRFVHLRETPEFKELLNQK